MTRFKLSSSSNSYGPPYGQSPTTLHFGGDGVGSPSTSLYSRITGVSERSTSVRLVTSSLDDQFVHSLHRDESSAIFFIESRRIPIIGESDETSSRDENDVEFPQLIRTNLPNDIRQALDIDPPIELFCVEGGKSHSTSVRTKPRIGRKIIHRLCLYTRKSVFLLSMEHSIHGTKYGLQTQYGTPVTGKVTSVTEPFERLLDTTRRIVIRARPSPQLCGDNITVVPTPSMAMLVFDRESREYSILLLHGNGSITTPAEWLGPEDVAEIQALEKIVDFCFAQSLGLSIFSSMAILLIKASGDVMAITPILFDGTVISKSFVQEGIDYLQVFLQQQFHDRNSPMYRQYRAAEQYLIDVFGFYPAQNDAKASGTSFCTANVLCPSTSETAATWPVSIQGPVVPRIIDENNIAQLAVTIETFGSTENFAGVAIGYGGCVVDFAAISPTSLIPRFSFEAQSDANALNEELDKHSSIVERVGLSPTDSNNEMLTDCASISLIRDPFSSHLLHYATSSFVGTISTNMMKIASRKLSGQPIHDPVKTTAWASIHSGSVSKSPVIGISVYDDMSEGHTLLAILSDGSPHLVNVTQTQVLHELDAIQKGETPLLITNSAVPTLELSTTPLHEKIQPLVTKITRGLSDLCKIVGTDTSYKDIKPDALAVAVDLKKKCDKEVIIPLFELKSLVDAHRKQLKAFYNNQKKQIQELNKSVVGIRDKMSLILEQLAKADENATALADRSKNLVQACNGLIPTVTQAEKEFFHDLKRLDLKVSTLETDTDRLKSSVHSRCNAFTKDEVVKVSDLADVTTTERIHLILKGEAVWLERTSQSLREKEDKLRSIHQT